MTDKYKGFLVTLEKEIRDEDAKNILTALGMIKGVQLVKPYVNGCEDWMMYEKGVWDMRKEMFDFMKKDVFAPKK